MARPMWLVFVLALPSAAAAEKAKIAVLPAQMEASAKGMVPKLFDDYLLTAVQNAGDFEVIGQDDINALIGFEKQKQLVGCDDVTCMADIGGALGVDRLVIVQIARLKNEWVSTAKLVNIRQAKVESRSSDFVAGDTKALLEAVPSIVRKLFAGGGTAAPASVATPTPPPAQVFQPPPPAVTKSIDPSLGRSQRSTGTILLVSGLVAAAGGVIVSATMGSKMVGEGEEAWREDGLVAVNVAGTCTQFTTADWDSLGDTAPAGDTLDDSECDVFNMGGILLGSAITGGGLVLAGVGAQKYLDGKAKAQTGDENAEGHFPYMWLGYLLAAVGVGSPILAASIDNEAIAWAGGLGGAIGSATVFGLALGSDSAYATTSAGREVPLARMLLVPDGRGGARPVFALAMQF
ncbi:MAG: hypothetical protein HYZ27_00230 [Deltaproteobacteria bacterium]|nr:hypothetical protein [Deltaproteobacteria bacterium]